MPQHRFMSNRKMLLGEDSNALVFLFALNMLIFTIINFIKIVYYLTDAPIEQFQHQIVEWFSMPASFVGVWHKPWTLLIHFFSQYSFWQLTSSMLWLWCFGYIFQDLSGNKHIIPVYIYAGIIGAITFLVTASIMASAASSIQPLLGAGAGVMGIAVSTTVLAPQYRLFPLLNGGFPLWIVTALFIVLDLSSSANQLPVLISHIVAAFVGFIYMKQLQNGVNLGNWMVRFYNWSNNALAPKNTRIVKADTRGFDSSETRLNTILDKMNVVGYENLSDDEKAFLKSISQE
jgi:membrane associated rhomboid family serine protease